MTKKKRGGISNSATTPEQRDQIVQMYTNLTGAGEASGAAVSKIAKTVGVSPTLVYYHTKKLRQRGTAGEEAKQLAMIAATPPSVHKKKTGGYQRPPGSEIEPIVARLIGQLERLDITEIHVNVEKREAEIKRQPTKKIRLE